MNPENIMHVQTAYTHMFTQWQEPKQNKVSSPTLAEWLDEWMDTYKTCTVKPQTAKMYRETILLIKTCPEASLLLIDCTERNMQRLLNGLQIRQPVGKKSTYSKSILTKVRITLTAAFKTAKTERLIPTNPCVELITPVAPVKQILPLSHTEQESVEQACRVDPLGHLYIFLLRTGLRLSELINLQWSDYDAKDKKINIRISKTPAGVRTVYLLKEAQDIIEAQQRLSNSIFNNTKGKPITKSSIRCLTERLCKNSQITRLTPHVCRHTFVTRLCEKGISAKAIAQIIGHACADYVLDIYAMMESQELRKAIYVLEEDKPKDK